MQEIKILSDSWYTNDSPFKVIKLDDFIKANYSLFIFKLSKKNTFVRGWITFLAAKEFDKVVTHLAHNGVSALLIFEALFSKKKNRIILLEFIRPAPQNKLKNMVWPFYTKYIFGPSLRNALNTAQVLTLHERQYYATTFNVPIERFSFIAWPIHGKVKTHVKSTIQAKPFVPISLEKQYVMVSGKLNVDWETIFEVAENSNWQLLAVCLADQLERVKKLNKKGVAKILNDISHEEHGFYVKGATVYALCLKDSDVSVGQIRLMNTNENGVAVVATKVAGLEGYAVDGINAVLVPPNNPVAFKVAIDKLISNNDLRLRLIKSAKEHQQGSTFENYLYTIYQLLKN